MTSFRTEFDYDVPHPDLKRNHKILFSGSCFSEHFGNYLYGLEYDVLCNPFGVIFNPVSLFKLCLRALNNEVFQEEELFEHDGLWRSFDVHSRVCGSDREETLKLINAKLSELGRTLTRGDHLFFTFGTSVVYRHKTAGAVANCHKLPASHFTKTLAGIDESGAVFREFYDLLSRVNSRCEVTLTVSPVRHLRDGFIENNRSKARLIELSHLLSEEFENVRYWPAYELVMDDLRDYRFFNRDRVHPTNEAVEYVREKWEQCFLIDRDRKINARLQKIITGLAQIPENQTNREKLKTALLKKLSLVEDEFKSSFPRIKEQINCILPGTHR